MSLEINEDCLYLKKVLKLLDKIEITDSEDDTPEHIQGSGKGDYLQRRAHRRHTQTNYEDILHEADWDEENDESLTVVCYWKGICKADEDNPECPTQEYAYHLIKQRANEISRNW